MLDAVDGEREVGERRGGETMGAERESLDSVRKNP